MRSAASLEFEQVFCDRPAIVFRTHPVLLRHAHIVEEHLVHFVLARQRDDRLDLDAGRIHVEKKKSDALLRLAARIRAHETEHHVREMRMRGPDLDAVEHIVVALAHCFQLKRGEVRSRARLRIALAPVVFAGEDARQVVILLFPGAELHQHRPAHAKPHGRKARCAVARALRGPDIFLHLGPARAAIFDRPARRDPAFPVEDLLPGEVPLLVREDGGGALARIRELRRQVLVEKGAHFVAEGSIRRREIQIHFLLLLCGDISADSLSRLPCGGKPGVTGTPSRSASQNRPYSQAPSRPDAPSALPLRKP